MGLFSNRSQRTLKCGKTISDTRLRLVCHFFVLNAYAYNLTFEFCLKWSLWCNYTKLYLPVQLLEFIFLH